MGLRHNYKYYTQIFEPLGFKVFSRDFSNSAHGTFDLYYNELGCNWFGEFTVKGKSYITSQGDKTDSPEDLIMLITEYNKIRVCPSYCYNPAATSWANLGNAFSWYLETLGFHRDSGWHYTNMILTNIYGEEISKIYIDLPKDDSYNGSIIRNIAKSFSWIEASFNSVDSMISAVNSVLEPELLINAANSINSVTNMTKSRTNTEFKAITNNLDVYKCNTKNAVKTALEEALNRLNQ